MKLFIKKTPATRMLFFAGMDVIFVIFSVWIAFFIRFDGVIPPHYSIFISRMAVLTIIFIVPIFYFQGLYSFSWAYVSANELISLFSATTISFIFLGITIYISKYFPYFLNFPKSVLFISYFLVFILCGGIRLSKRIYLHFLGKNGKFEKDRTLIVGAGDAGEQILRSISSSKNSLYFPIGFVDDNSLMQGLTIHGLKVIGKIQDIPKIVKNHQVKQMVIALPSAGVKIIKKAAELGRGAGLKKIKIAPRITEIINGQISLKNLKDIDVEDLLFREPVGIDEKQIEKFIENKTVLITGAAGSIGSELSRQVSKFKPSLLLLLDQDETGIFNILEELKNKFPRLKIQPEIADIRDEKRINGIFRKFQPKIIFHAAAYKHVPLMEEQSDEAVKNNIFGTEVLAKASLDFGVEKFVQISTDKAVNPSSVMGCTKRVCEMLCQAYNHKGSSKFVSVRFGNVLNSRGSVIPAFREQIKRGGPVEVTDPEMKRYFMLISEACLLVMQAGAMGRGGEVFVLDMGEPIKILDLAKEMIRLSGLEPDKDIAIVFTGQRPGEKLFEEILTAEEGTIATKNQKIFIAKLSEVNAVDFEKKLENLGSLIESGQTERKKIITALSGIVPKYKPNEKL